jgi:acyl carrier protein
MYAQALEYPEEVFAQDTDLEAELGVDSVKQTELLARVSAHYELPAPDESFRLSHYGTLARIADLVCAGPATDRGTAAPAEPVVLTAVPASPPADDRTEILRTLTAMYALALEYPEEVFAQDTDLEAELGVDSVKQTELLARVSAHYELPAPDESFRLSHYGTLARIADLVQFSSSRPELISA